MWGLWNCSMQQSWFTLATVIRLITFMWHPCSNRWKGHSHIPTAQWPRLQPHSSGSGGGSVLWWNQPHPCWWCGTDQDLCLAREDQVEPHLWTGRLKGVWKQWIGDQWQRSLCWYTARIGSMCFLHPQWWLWWSTLRRGSHDTELRDCGWTVS